MQQNLMWIAIAVVSGVMLIWPMLTGTGIDSIAPATATLKMNREDAILLDVRESSEWSNGHIPNARHITLGQLDKRLSEIEKYKERPIIIYCATGNRSRSACNKLKQAGFAQVFNLAGGIAAWSDANLPVTKKN